MELFQNYCRVSFLGRAWGNHKKKTGVGQFKTNDLAKWIQRITSTSLDIQCCFCFQPSCWMMSYDAGQGLISNKFHPSIFFCF